MCVNGASNGASCKYGLSVLSLLNIIDKGKLRRAVATVRNSYILIHATCSLLCYYSTLTNGLL